MLLSMFSLFSASSNYLFKDKNLIIKKIKNINKYFLLILNLYFNTYKSHLILIQIKNNKKKYLILQIKF